MHRNLLALTSSLLLTVGAGTAAQATVVLEQPLLFVDGRASSVFDGGTTGFVTSDRISIAQSTQVDRVSWVGAFIDTQNTANNPVPPAADRWILSIAADAGGNPGATTDSVTLDFAQASATLLGSASLAGQPVNVYRFTADLIDPLLIAGGAEQWFSVVAENALQRAGFAWMSGSGGDGLARQQQLGGGLLGPYTDRALTLEGQTVPEAPTLALLAIALVAAAYRRAHLPRSRGADIAQPGMA